MKTGKHSKVMTIANSLVKQGYNRSNAMVKAWDLFVRLLISEQENAFNIGFRAATQLFLKGCKEI